MVFDVDVEGESLGPSFGDGLGFAGVLRPALGGGVGNGGCGSASAGAAAWGVVVDCVLAR